MANPNLNHVHTQHVQETPDYVGDVRQFMLMFGQARQVADYCHLPPQEVRDLRRSLIEGEVVREFFDNWFNNDIPAIADDLADIIYVVVGTALAYGIPLNKVWQVVQEANMLKAWTHAEVTVCENIDKGEWHPRRIPDADPNGRCFAVLDDAGKVMKPPSWQDPAPKVKAIIDEASKIPEQEARRKKWLDSLSSIERAGIATHTSEEDQLAVNQEAPGKDTAD